MSKVTLEELERPLAPAIVISFGKGGGCSFLTQIIFHCHITANLLNVYSKTTLLNVSPELYEP